MNYLQVPNQNPYLSQPGTRRQANAGVDSGLLSHLSDTNWEDEDAKVPATEEDELLHPQQTPRLKTQSPRTGFPDFNPKILLQATNLERNELGLTEEEAKQAVGIEDPEGDRGALPLFKDIKNPLASGESTPRYGGDTSPVSIERKSKGSPSMSPRLSVFGIDSILSKGDYDDDIETGEVEEDVSVQMPLSNMGSPLMPGSRRILTVPFGSNVDEDASALADSRSLNLLEATKPESNLPSLSSLPQDPDVKGFTITPGGLTSTSVKLNAIVDENGKMIPSVQMEYINPVPTKWVITNRGKKTGMLWFAEKDLRLFVYVCFRPHEKSQFFLGEWEKREDLAEYCKKNYLGDFFFTGWDLVRSTPKMGAPAADAEIVFENPAMKGLNNVGFFGLRWPDKSKDDLYDVRRDAEGKEIVRFPKYTEFTILPAELARLSKDSMPKDDRPFWLYMGDVQRTGNKVEKGWTVEDIMNGAPIQFQGSVPLFYPMYCVNGRNTDAQVHHRYLTEVDPKTDPFRAKRNIHGTDVVLGSLEAYPKPGVWYYDKKDDMIYLWGSKPRKFMYTCRSEAVGGAFLRVGTKREALDDCQPQTKDRKMTQVYAIRPKFSMETTYYRHKAKVELGPGVLWVTPDREWTVEGYAYNSKWEPQVARLMTIGPPNYNGMSRKAKAAAKDFRRRTTMIIEAFVVDIPSGPYTQYTVYQEIYN
ncbi:hypothetical protein ABW19_dt0204041 [Dactylella cylindrospora]|nr:hypothetical protein ABW19_dt0204041 [Dactylella cylindrospora]